MQLLVFRHQLPTVIDDHVGIVNAVRRSPVGQLMETADREPQIVGLGQRLIVLNGWTGYGFGQRQRFGAIASDKITAFGKEDELNNLKTKLIINYLKCKLYLPSKTVPLPAEQSL